MSLMGSPQWAYATGADYTIDQSLKFEEAREAYLARTPTSNGNRDTWTFSTWVKFTKEQAGIQPIFYAADPSNGNYYTRIGLISANQFFVNQYNNSAFVINLKSSAVLRDYSAWYHLVVATDTGQNTDTNRVKMYINGELVTDRAETTWPSQNLDTYFNSTSYNNYICAGNGTNSPDLWGSMYQAETHFIDGAQVVPGAFGETGDFGEWKPKEYSVSDYSAYGTNGFYLPYKADYAVEGFGSMLFGGRDQTISYVGGMGFHPSFIIGKTLNYSAGFGNFDTVMGLPFQSSWQDGGDSAQTTMYHSFEPDGVVIGTDNAINYAGRYYVIWGWDMGDTYGVQHTLAANGNAQHSTAQQKFGASSMLFDGTGDGVYINPSSDAITNSTPLLGETSRFFDLGNGDETGNFRGEFTLECWVRLNAVDTAAYALIDIRGNHGDYIELYYTDAGSGRFDVAGTNITTIQGSTTPSANTWYHLAVVRHHGIIKLYQDGTEIGEDLTTGQCGGPGYNVSIGQYRTMDGSTAAGEYLNGYLDEVRISNKARYIGNFTAPTAAFTSDKNTLLLIHSDTSNGSTTFTDSSGAPRNTNGTIESIVAANDTYGQSIVEYIGTGANGTVGHGLSAAPDVVIVTNRNSSGTAVSAIQHKYMYGGSQGYLRAMYTSTDAAVVSGSTYWNDTAPTSTVVSVGSHNDTNLDDGQMHMYCFRSVTGYSKFDKYTGNASTSGPTITTGFRPAWVAIKKTETTEDWYCFSQAQEPGRDNLVDWFELNDAGMLNHGSGPSGGITISDTGFQITDDGTEMNSNNSNYVYMAFADNREYSFFLDQSGNNNDFDPINMSESAISLDTPTNNFCTLNPLSQKHDNKPVLSEGNLQAVAGASTTKGGALGTMSMPTGKWYWEVYISAHSTWAQIGIIDEREANSTSVGTTANPSRAVVYWNDGNVKKDGSTVNSTPDAYASGDIIGVAFDADGNSIKFYKDGVLQSTYTPDAGGHGLGYYTPCILMESYTVIANFGQDSSFANKLPSQGYQDGNSKGDFYYEVPSGYLALCTNNLADIADGLWDDGDNQHFSAIKYDGDDTQRTITTGVQSDLIIVKQHNTTNNNWYVVDAVRGIADAAGTSLVLDQSGEGGNASTQVDAIGGATSWQSGASADYTNGGSRNYINYTWKANGAGSAQTAANLDGTVSCNPTAGFVISKYEGNGSAGQSFALGEGAWSGSAFPTSLNKAPEMMWIKNIDDDDNWVVFVKANPHMDQTDKLRMDTDMALVDDNDAWADMSPSQYWAYVDTDNQNNGSGNDIIAYCWHSVDGYSRIGSYVGTGNVDGTFVYTGFRPEMVITKKLAQEDWWCIDNNQYTDNPNKRGMLLSTSGGTYGSDKDVDLLSNGFKPRVASGFHNDSGALYIFIAFAETPFKYANAK